MVSFIQISPLCISLSSPIRATCPAHFILLDFITQTVLGEQNRSLSSSLCRFLHSPFTSSLLGPNSLLNTLFSDTLSLRSPLNLSDQVSHPYKTTGKIIVLFILIFTFFGQQTRRQKILCRMITSIPWIQCALNLFLNIILIWSNIAYVNITDMFRPLMWPSSGWWEREYERSCKERPILGGDYHVKNLHLFIQVHLLAFF